MLAHYSARYGLKIWAYCLMTNHVNLLAVPVRPESMAMAVGRTHMTYSREINSSHHWTGHLWANRYYSAPVHREGAPVVARYIELHPVRAESAASPEDYPWSSAAAHCLRNPDPVLDSGGELAPDPTAWRGWLQDGISDQETEDIRRSTATGTPLRSPAFVAELERTLGRRLVRRKYTKRKAEE
jgi:putative transposase